MGAQCSGEVSHDDKVSKERGDKLDKMTKQQSREQQSIIKLLLLGTGDSGKSTFLKQMKVSQMDGFSRNETLTYMGALKHNTLKSMQRLIQIAEEQGKEFGSRTMKLFDTVKNSESENDMSIEVAKAISRIWKDAEMVKFYHEVAPFAQVPSCTPYYFENAERYVGDFKPTTDDIIRAKLKTTGIYETSFQFNNAEFKIVDVGGQRAERRKWMHCFTDVRAIIYLVALDEYNMILEEDGTTNRMEESINLFGEISESRYIEDLLIVLFLNKSDLFEEKLPSYPIRDYFKDAPKSNDSEECYEFIKKKYESAYNGRASCYSFKTCGLDTDKCVNVFASVADDVLRSAMGKAGI
jgi:GTPase SAR1 family protein